MKTHEPRERIFKDTVLIETQCDICKRIVKGELDKEGVEVTMESCKGYSCYDGGHQVYTEFDVCGQCFEEKVIPWMKEQFNAEPRKREVDW